MKATASDEYKRMGLYAAKEVFNVAGVINNGKYVYVHGRKKRKVDKYERPHPIMPDGVARGRKV